MMEILFSKYSKFYVGFEKAINFQENIFAFGDNCVSS